jgi:hypothetical protein
LDIPSGKEKVDRRRYDELCPGLPIKNYLEAVHCTALVKEPFIEILG